LTVSDGVHSAAITILGNHVTSNFTAVSDGNGGTLISDPQLPVSSGQAGNVQPGRTAVATTIDTRNGGMLISDPQLPVSSGQAGNVQSGGTAVATTIDTSNGGTLISNPQLPVSSSQAGNVQSGGTGVATTIDTNGNVGGSSGVDTGTATQTSRGQVDSFGGSAINSANSDVAGTGSAITSGSSATTGDTPSSGSSPHQWWADLGGTTSGFFGEIEPELMASGRSDVGDPWTPSPGDNGEMAQFALWRQYTPTHFTWASDGGSSTPVSNPAAAANEMLAGNGGSQHLSHA
jgi:hypothetical protein